MVDYLILYNDDNIIILKDLAHINHTMSITNGAEEVISELAKNEYLTKQKKVFFIDTIGIVDELLHDGEKFIDFKLHFIKYTDINKLIKELKK